MTRRIGIAKLIMLTTIATTRGNAALATDWSETLEAAANVAYVSNPTMQPGSSVSDETAQLIVDGSTRAQTELDQFSITPRIAVTRYAHETDLDIVTGSIDVGFQKRLERGAWTLAGEALTDSTVTSELGTTGLTNVNRRHYANTLSLGYQYYASERLSWQLQSAWQDTRYTDAQSFGLTNYTYTTLAFGPTWSFSDRILGSVNLEADRLSPDTGVAQNSYSASLQVKRSFTEKYSWRVSAGATRVEASGAGSATSALLEIGATRTGERVQWDLSFRRAVLPVGLGLLASQDLGSLKMSISTSERSNVNLSFNLIKSDPVYFLQYVVYNGATWGQATAEWQYHLSQHWALSAALQQARARNYPQEWANGTQARLGILWQSGRL